MSGTRTLVTTEAIHAFLVAHPGSTFQKVQDSMHCSFPVAKRLLDQMRRDGLLTVTPNGGFHNSYLFWPAEAPDMPAPPTVAQSRTPPEFKPLALDMGKFMRLCQGARNSVTGERLFNCRWGGHEKPNPIPAALEPRRAKDCLTH